MTYLTAVFLHWENYISISFGAQVRYPLNPLNTIVLWCTGGFRGALNWTPLMPRDASLSDSCSKLHSDYIFASALNKYAVYSNEYIYTLYIYKVYTLYYTIYYIYILIYYILTIYLYSKYIVTNRYKYFWICLLTCSIVIFMKIYRLKFWTFKKIVLRVISLLSVQTSMNHPVYNIYSYI